MRKLRISMIWAVLLGVAIATAPVAASADDSELFISRVRPNILLMVDKSGSMRSNPSGSTGIGNLTAIGSSYGVSSGNLRIDALWKVVYTLLNADMSVPQGGAGGGTTTSITCKTKEFNGDENISAGTRLLNMRLGDCDNFSSLPSSGTISFGASGRIEVVTYNSKGACSGGHGNCLFFNSPGVLLAYRHGEDERVTYSSTTGGSSTFQYILPYPAPASINSTGTGAPDEGVQARNAYYVQNSVSNLTSADESALKARIGLLDFTGTLSPYSYDNNVYIRNQIPSNAPNAAPYSSPIRYQDIWNSIITYGVPNSSGAVYTPTAWALSKANTFFNTAYDNATWCRPNVAILITDGEDTMGLLSTESGTPSGANDAAQRTRHNRMIQKAYDLYNDTTKVKLYTVGVGIGVPGDSNTYLRELREVLRRAADQKNEQLTSSQVTYVNTNGDNVLKGSGRAFFASDATELSAAIGQIVEQAAAGDYVFTSPTVSSVRTTDRNYLFMGSFVPKAPPATFWRGSLEARTVNADGTTNLRWDADNVLVSTGVGTRRIYSASGSGSPLTRLHFGVNTEGGSNPCTAPSSTCVDNTMLGVSSATGTTVINNIRGTGRTYESGDPAWKLGDIFHSKPVLVGEPSRLYIDDGYSTSSGFYSLYQHRQRVVYAGANDGALHAFAAGSWSTGSGSYVYDNTVDGKELFAYVPKLLLNKVRYAVQSTTSSHRYYVDSSPRVADVWLPTSGSWTDATKNPSEWRTVLVAGLRKGGQGYFALDVTNPSQIGTSGYPVPLWEYDNTSILADTWSEPYIAKIKYRNDSTSDTTPRDRWVAIFGGGKSSTNDVGNRLIVMDIATGTPIRIFDNTTGPGIVNEIVASPSAVLDSGGYLRYIYVPDVGGNLYRFNFTAVGTRNTGLTEWNYVKKFTPTSGGQPAYYRAEVGSITENTRFVYFGTGNKDYPVTDTGTGKFYGIRDADTDNTTVTEGSVGTPLISLTAADSTLTSAISPPTYGWVLNLASITSLTGVDTSTHSGEKVLSDPVVFNNNVYFTTYTPTVTGLCTGGGISRLYGLNYITGGAALSGLTDAFHQSGRAIVPVHRLLGRGRRSRHVPGDHDRFPFENEEYKVLEGDPLTVRRNSRTAWVATMLAVAILASGTACGKKEPVPAGTVTGGGPGDANRSPATVVPSDPGASGGAGVKAVIVPPSPSKLIPPRISVEAADGQSIKTVQVRWKVAGAVVSEGERLPAALFRKGDAISALVSVETSKGTVSLETPAVTAVKSLPSVTDVRLEPATIRTGSSVRAVAQGESPDGGPLTFRYKWFVDDVQVKGDAAERTLADVGKGAWVHVQVLSNDGVSDGGWKYSPKYRVYGPPPVVRVEGEPVVAPDGVFAWTVSVSGGEGALPAIELVSGPAGMTLSGSSIRWAVPEESFGKEARLEVKVPEDDRAWSTQVLAVFPQKR
jgi:Tfp pilus tip-associated adhesin PilY1